MLRLGRNGDNPPLLQYCSVCVCVCVCVTDNVDEVQFVRIRSLGAASIVECMCIWLGFGCSLDIWCGGVVVVVVVVIAVGGGGGGDGNCVCTCMCVLV